MFEKDLLMQSGLSEIEASSLWQSVEFDYQLGENPEGELEFSV